MNTKQWITALTSGRLVRQTVTVQAKPRSGDSWQDIPASNVQPVLDESTSPFAEARIEINGTIPAEMLDPSQNLWDVRVNLGLSTNDASEDQQVFYGVIISIEEANGRLNLVCMSDEELLARTAFPPGLAETACPQLNSLALIWTSIRSKLTIAAGVPINSVEDIPAAQRSSVWAIPFGGGDRPLDYLRTLADAAGLWLHSDQSPDSTGGLICEARPTFDEVAAVDLRGGGDRSLVIDQSSSSGLTGDYASAILLTCTWPTGEATGLIPASTSVDLTPAVKPINLSMRPPTAYQSKITGNWAAAQALADRQAARSWESRIVIPGLPWLRPGQTVITDKGIGLIKSIAWEPLLGTATVSIRPA